MPLAAEPIGAGLGWRGVFVLSAVTLAVSAVSLKVLLVPDALVSTTSIGTALLILPRILRRWRMAAIYVATSTVLAAYVGVFIGLQLSGPSDLVDSHGIQHLRAATLPALLLVALFVGRIHGVPAPRRAFGGLVLAAASVGVVGVAGASFLAVTCSLIVFVAAVAATAPALVAYIVSLTSADEASGATALYGGAMFVGGAAGPVMARVAAPYGLELTMWVWRSRSHSALSWCG